MMTANQTDKLNSASGGPQNSLLFYCLYLYQLAFARLEMGLASAMAWLLFWAAGAITLLVFATSKQWVYYGGDD